MKHIYTLTLFFIFNIANSQTLFEWETGSSNGDNATETISGVTVTLSSSGVSDFFVGSCDGCFSTSGKIAGSESTLAQSVTFNFSSPIDVNSILAIDAAEGSTAEFTFTPTGGTNSVVVQPLVNQSAQVTLNWTNVNSFTVSSNGYNNNNQGSVFAFDNLSTNFDTAKTTEGNSIESIKVYPNPIKNFIRISGLTRTKNYELFNVLGAKVLKGTISNNQKISVNNLTNGLYFLKFDSGNTLKIIKE